MKQRGYPKDKSTACERSEEVEKSVVQLRLKLEVELLRWVHLTYMIKNFTDISIRTICLSRARLNMYVTLDSRGGSVCRKSLIYVRNLRPLLAESEQLSRPLRLTAMLRVYHLTKFEQSCSTHARVMDECNSDHAYSWVNITSLLTE